MFKMIFMFNKSDIQKNVIDLLQICSHQVQLSRLCAMLIQFVHYCLCLCVGTHKSVKANENTESNYPNE